MVVGSGESEHADALFHALADPTRRDILAVVLQDAHSVSDLARRYPISFAAVEWRCEGGRELSIRALVPPHLATR